MPAEPRADVELRVPAAGAYAAVVRTTAAGLAARLDFTIDDIEDLRIAIGEAIALTIAEADDGADLVCAFHLHTGAMQVELSTGAAGQPEVDPDGFAWQVLDTMADDVRAESSPGRFAVRFTISSDVTAGATGVEL
ncbi:MAG: anti-sigma factor [Nocardioides sp.]|nr:anti-sigma factor [Nocardioides sp.]